MGTGLKGGSRRTVTGALVLPMLFVALAVAACGGSGASASTPPSVTPGDAAASPSAASSPSALPLPAPTVAGTIAYGSVVTAGSGGNSDIYVVNADGTGLKQLTDGAGWETHPSWSPDGATIAFQRARTWADLAIFSLQAAGGGLKRVTRPASGAPVGQQADHVPDWALDGRVLFVRLSDVYSVDAGGGGLTRLTKVMDIGDFALSPDGKSLAIDNNTSQSIEIVPVRGGGPPVRVLHPIPDFMPDDPYAAPDWSPEGKVIAVASSSLEGIQGSRLYIVNADGTGLSAVPGVDAAWDPAWRPQ